VLAPFLPQAVSAQVTEEPLLPPVGRVRLAAVHAKNDLKSGVGHGKLVTRQDGKTIETALFQATFSGDKYAVTVHYPQPRKGRESITMQTMVTDGFFTFATQFSERLRPDGYATAVWREGRSIGNRQAFFLPAEVFPYDVTKLGRQAINVLAVLNNREPKTISGDDAQVELTWTSYWNTRTTLLADAHSGFNVTECRHEDDRGLVQLYKLGWQRQRDVWFVNRLNEKWITQDQTKVVKQYQRTLEYDDFQPNVEVDEKMFDLTRVEDGWYNDRIMYPHGKP
jgi:hypothetical protein